MLVYWIISIIIGCFIGFSFAYMLMGIFVSKSNNHGDSKGQFHNFATDMLNVIYKQDNIRKPKL